MRSLIIFLLCFVLGFEILPQNFSGKSTPTKLSIKIPPPDDIKPQLTLNLPSVLEGYPVNCKDTIYTLRGKIEDNMGKSKIFINNEYKGYFTDGTFKFDLNLKSGMNDIIIEARDKRDNYVKDTIHILQAANADVNPPIIKILEPVSLIERGIKIIQKFEYQDSVLRIEGKIFDENQILGLWINSELVDSLIDDLFSFTFFYPLPDTIQIIAADIYGNMSTEVFEVPDESSKDNAKISNIKFHALVITIQDYKDAHISPLDFPIQDGNELIRILTTKYTFEPKNIIHLRNATRAEIIKTFQQLRKKLGEDDNLLIFYAGHGYLDEKIDQGYWYPVDAKSDDQSNWLSNSNIKEYIKGIQSKHTLLIADACFAGNFLRSSDNSSMAEKSFTQIYKSKSRRYISSGTQNNKVPDKSFFMKVLLKALEENQERFLIAERLLLSIKETVRVNTPNNQVPQYGIVKEAGDEVYGDFQFIRK